MQRVKLIRFIVKSVKSGIDFNYKLIVATQNKTIRNANGAMLGLIKRDIRL